jgi:hypothetical protein
MQLERLDVDKDVFIFRAKHIVESMEHINVDGKDVHKRDNLRHSAQMLLETLHDGVDEELERVLLNLEDQTRCFILKKFG